MKYSKATNYALHTMVYLTTMPRSKATGVDVLAKQQDVSPTYLSKILTKLVKSGLIESTPGVNGGYTLSRNGKQISFLDVIHAIEGQSVLFRCSSDHEDAIQRKGCLIEKAMTRAEDRLKEELDKTTIADIADEVGKSRE